jgi:hypothetical protein
MTNHLHTNKKVGIALLVSTMVDLRIRAISRAKKEQLQMIIKSTHKEYIIILNVCAPNNKNSE